MLNKEIAMIMLVLLNLLNTRVAITITVVQDFLCSQSVRNERILHQASRICESKRSDGRLRFYLKKKNKEVLHNTKDAQRPLARRP